MAEDSYTSSEVDTTATRKRHYDEDEEAEGSDARDSKKAYGKEPLLKLLIPSEVAGAIIGKGGANLIDLKSRYGAAIRLSHHRECYPGTNERIVVLTGDISQIIDLNNYIIDKIHQNSPESRGQEIKIIVPNKTAGLIIGKGGSVIKEMKEETKAGIEFTGRDESPVFGERILTIKGNTEQRIEAASQVISKIASDADNMANTTMKYSDRSRDDGNGYGHREPPRERRMGGFQEDNRNSNGNMLSAMSNANNLSNMAEVAQQLVGLAQGQRGSASIEHNIKTTVQIQMEIPELLVNPIMGPQGNYLREFSQFSGAKMEFSRSDLGISQKMLTILGDLNQTQIGYHLISQKIAQVRNELAAAGLARR